MFPQQQHFRLTRQALLLAMVASAFPVTGYCVTAGRADFVVGTVMAVAADGSQRPLVKGSEINVGESVNTAAGARAQIRFTDGGYVSLQPNSLFRVDEYNYENKADGKEKGFFSLLRGGLRTITGAIGHVNRDKYQVATPAATIGIRGTGYNAMLGEGLTVSVADGVISLTNKGGSLILSQGQSAFVADLNTAPTLTFEKPSTPPASLGGTTETPPEYKTGDCVGTSCGGGGGLGGLTVLTGVHTVFSGSVVDGAGGVTTVGSDNPGIVVFDQQGSKVYYVQGGNPIGPAGGLTDFSAAALGMGVSGTDTVGAAMLGYTYPATGLSIPASGYDGTVGWGRFYGTVTYTEPGSSTVTTVFTANQGMHSVVGIPTAVMPTSGSAHYDLTGATAPTLASGSVSPGTVTGGGLDVWFSGTPELYGTLALALGGKNFNLKFDGNFSGNSFVASTAYALSSNGGCSGSCAADVSGFFAGANAARAGVAYKIDGSFALGSAIRGAAVYTQTATPVSSTPPSGW